MRSRNAGPEIIATRAFARLLGTTVLAAALVAAQARIAMAEDDMTFESVQVNGVRSIAAVGRITEATPQLYANFVRQNGGAGATVYLASLGGSVVASMEFGTLMRKAGAAAVVGRVTENFFGGPPFMGAQCFSACVYALMGARKRVIPQASSIGIHRMFLSIEGQGDVTAFATREERAAAGGVRAMLTSYTGRMGVSTGLIAQAESTRSDDIHILTRSEILKWHLGVPN